MRAKSPILLLAVLLTLLGSAACNDTPPPPKTVVPSPSDTKKPPPIKEVPKPEGAPELRINAAGPKVGWTTVLIEKKDGQARLRKALAEHKKHFEDDSPTLLVDRKAKLPWVIAMFQELDYIGASSVTVVTDTRKEFDGRLRFTFQSKVRNPPRCALVLMVLKDRSTAVWKLSGGTAMRRAKGFAGPDLTTTAETIERLANACSDSKLTFLSAQEGVEWGLVYDLAASAQKIEDVTLNTAILLESEPTPGRPVKL
jgi:hypothetical protein